MGNRLSRLKERAERLGRGSAKLLALGPGGWWLLLRVQRALLKARWDLRRRPIGSLLPEIRDRSAVAPPGTSEQAAQVERVGLAVDRVARAGLTRPLCLERSLAYHRLLESRGIMGAAIRVGVRKVAAGLEAHAWVEWDGRVVGEDPAYPAQFLPLPLEQVPDLAGQEGFGLRWVRTPRQF